MSEKIRGDGYELVPESRFEKLVKKVDDILSNPLIDSSNAKKIAINLETVNGSLEKLLEVMKEISNKTSFEEKEENIISDQIKPLVKSVKNIHKQNDTIANGMVNIIDRLNDMQSQIDELKKNSFPIPSDEINPSLPPLSGGTKSPISDKPRENPDMNNSQAQSMPANNSNNNANLQQNNNIATQPNKPTPPPFEDKSLGSNNANVNSESNNKDHKKLFGKHLKGNAIPHMSPGGMKK
ncbi:MAG: hypothetical protein ACQER9_00890 [Nanobdellota archaeon]